MILTDIAMFFHFWDHSGYGQTGPYRTAAGYDVIIEAEAGLMHMFVEYDSYSNQE
jgi:crotonobetainyl-CoA:carnitine CoA-transferase CaiB-like acyl-CoA transferase